jgi:DNA-binding NarL/FixJ family response regulator
LFSGIPAVVIEVVKPGKERKSLPLSVKLEVIKRIEAGQRNEDICLAMHLSASTVRTIFVNKEQIRTTAESVVGAEKLRIVSKVRHPFF